MRKIRGFEIAKGFVCILRGFCYCYVIMQISEKEAVYDQYEYL